VAGKMMEITGNRRNALWLAGLSLATSLLAFLLLFLFFTEGVGFSPLVLASPVVLILAFAPLAGMLGIISRNKEVLVISSLMSLALTILGIVSIGLFFVAPSLLLIISTFVYLRDEPAVEVSEKARRSALIAALASLFVAIAAIATEVFSTGSMLALAFGLILLIPPVLGIIGIRNRNKEFLFASCAISLMLAIFLGLLLRKPLFLASSLVLVLSAFAYQGGVIGEFKREMPDARLKNIAILLADIALVAAMGATLYSERVLVSGGCYTYHTSPTSGGRICSDFRIDYVIPVIISLVGMAGILRENKLLLYASATASFIRIVVYLQPIANLFLPSFVALIFSALVYKIGIRRVEPYAEVQENIRQYYALLLLSLIVIFWIIAVYLFVQPSSVEHGYGYAYSPTPAKQVP
jgi:MFS family permease